MSDDKGAPVMSGLIVHEESHDDPIGTIATPYRDHMTTETHISMVRTDYRWADGRPINRLFIQGSQLPLQRNEAVMRMKGDWLLMIDDDMVFAKDVIGALVSTYHQLKETVKEPFMVGALCVRRYEPYQPTLFKAVDPQKGPFNFLEDWEGADIVEVDATGAAFVLVEEDVFSAVMGGPLPSYDERLQLKPWPFFEWVGTMGEDLRFCMKARNAGCRVFVDTRIRIGHVGQKVYDITDFWHAVAERPKEIEDARVELNDSMGLPTLKAEEARGRLDF